MFAEATAESHSLELVQPVDTNIVLLRVRNPGDVVADTAQYVAKLAHAGVVTALGYDPTLIRAVFHLDISRAMTEKACDVVRSI
jgi:threonine aldolase